MNTDPYLATKDIEVKKHICSIHMRTHLTSNNMSYRWYEENYPLWLGRVMRLFHKSWNNALRYAFTKEELGIWEKCKEVKQKNKKLKYTDNDVIILFVKEYLRLKSDPNFGHFNVKDYKKYKSKNGPSDTAIIRRFGSFKNFYMHVTSMYPDIYFDPIHPYTEKDFQYSLVHAYKNNGFISYAILDFNKGYICAAAYTREYKSLENACKRFNIPYENTSLHSKIFLYVKKIVEELLPSIEIVEEKQWPEWLFYKDPLSIDMFLPFFNLAIEVDGEQHYDPNSMFNSRRPGRFEIQQECDEIKNVRLPEHNITLIRIRDYEIDDTAEKIRYYVELLKTIQEYCAY